MKRGFTLFEMLIVLLITSLLLIIALPQWQGISAQQALNQEQRNLSTFLRQIQTRAENSNEIWYLVANRNIAKKDWCFAAQLKDSQICDCFRPNNCRKEQMAHFYYPKFPQKVMLTANKIYPEELTKMNGARNTNKGTCFLLQAAQKTVVFSLFNVGSLRLKPNDLLSSCKAEEFE